MIRMVPPPSSTPASYSLWFAPKGPVGERCAAEIKHFAALESLPDAHPFTPHCTVIGLDDFTLDKTMETTKQLAKTIPPLTIEFDRVSYGAIFHQCVYILCKETPELMAAGAAAKEAFQVGVGSKYMPHVSLIYSDCDAAMRQTLTAQAQARLFGNATSDMENADGPLPAHEYNVDSIEIWYTPLDDKTMKSWEKVGEVPLLGGEPNT